MNHRNGFKSWTTNDEIWTTNDEIMHVENIGVIHEGMPALSRRELLERYRIAAGRRADWCGMDRDRIMAALARAIHREAMA